MARSERIAHSLFAFCLLAGSTAFGEDDLAATRMRFVERAIDRQDFDTAIRILDTMLARDGRNPEIWLRRGRARMLKGDFQGAGNDFRKRSQLIAQRDGRGLACLAHCIASQALSAANSPERFAPGSLDRKRAVELRVTRLQLAIETYSEALDCGFESSGLYNNLGYCLRATNHLYEAEEYYQKAVRFETVPVAAYLHLSKADRRIAIREKRTPDLSHIENALRISPENSEVQKDAAFAFAFAAFKQSTGAIESQVDYVTRAITACDRAIALGMESSELRGLATYYPPLKDHARIKKIFSRRPGRGGIKLQKMVDPLIGSEAR